MRQKRRGVLRSYGKSSGMWFLFFVMLLCCLARFDVLFDGLWCQRASNAWENCYLTLP